MRFVVDHMLYKLGRYLRCLGFDVVLDPRASTAELVRLADLEGRVFLTRNSHLGHQHPRPLKEHLVRSNDPVEQVQEVGRALVLDLETRLFTRCVGCNELLEALPGDSPRLATLPERVRGRFRSFYTCPKCETVFWKGSHVTNTCRKLGLPDAAEQPEEDDRADR